MQEAHRNMNFRHFWRPPAGGRFGSKANARAPWRTSATRPGPGRHKAFSMGRGSKVFPSRELYSHKLLRTESL